MRDNGERSKDIRLIESASSVSACRSSTFGSALSSAVGAYNFRKHHQRRYCTTSTVSPDVRTRECGDQKPVFEMRRERRERSDKEKCDRPLR
jgi:hypothetical protein